MYYPYKYNYIKPVEFLRKLSFQHLSDELNIYNKYIGEIFNAGSKKPKLVKDIVKLKIINHINGTIHAKIDEPDLGVLFTKCRKCFGQVVQIRDAVKCKECSWIDDRKLSSDFGKNTFLK